MSVDEIKGKFFYRFTIEKREYRKQGFPTKADAERAEVLKKAEVINRDLSGGPDKDNLTLVEACDRYYQEYTLTCKRGFQEDRAHIAVIKGYFGKKRIRDISPLEIGAFRRHVSKTVKGVRQPQVSPHTVNRYHACLKAIINWARKKRLYSGDNPAWGVDMAKVEKARVRYLLPEEEQRLTPLIAKQPRLWPFYVVGLQTGMRVSEICAIQVKDVILHPEPMVFVAHSKSKCSRHVPLSDTVLQIFLERIKGHEHEPERRVLDQVLSQQVSRWFKEACEEAKVLNFTFHCLRHSFCAHMLSKGVPIYKVSKMLGHSTVTTTESHYGHLDKRVLSDEIRHVDDIMGGPKSSDLPPENGTNAEVVRKSVNLQLFKVV